MRKGKGADCSVVCLENSLEIEGETVPEREFTAC